MQHKKEEYFDKIIGCINGYYEKNGIPPTNREISYETGLSTATISRYINRMREDGIIESEGHRGVITKQFKNRSNCTNRIPIVGQIACGSPIVAEEYIEEYIYMPKSLLGEGRYYFLRANGNSMINIGISDGDLVLIKEQNIAEDGEVVVALVENEATLKRFYREKGSVRLHPENDDMDDMFVESCKIQGVAVKILKDVF